MRKIREVLRLKFDAGLSVRKIAASLSIGHSSAGDYLCRFAASGLQWPIDISDAELNRRLFPPAAPVPTDQRPMPDWSWVHTEMRRPGVTLALLWQEYRLAHPQGSQYSWFCEHYRLWAPRSMWSCARNTVPAKKLFVNYAGQTAPIIDRSAGEIRQGQIFVAVLGASSYTFAEATWSQKLPDWLGSHVRCFAFLGGTSQILVPDNLRSGVTKDHHGQVIPDPACNPSNNAFEGNPNLNFEHCGEYWRKVNGPRFVHTEEPHDQSLTRLLRYDQLHRFAPGPSHVNAPSYNVPVDEHGKLWPTVIGHIPPYQRPQWDGVAYLNFAAPEDMGIVFGSDRVKKKTLPEDQVIFRDIAPVLSLQYIVVPSQGSNDPVSLVKLHSRAQFVKENAGGCVRRHVQLHSISATEPGKPFYHPKTSMIDGVTLMAFASTTDLEDFLRSDGYAVIAENEGRMTNLSEGEWLTAIAMGIVNRIAPEHATAFCLP